MYWSGQLLILVVMPPLLAALVWLGFRSILAEYVDSRPFLKRYGFWLHLALAYVWMTALFLIENRR